jgi:hypothetical protein
LIVAGTGSGEDGNNNLRIAHYNRAERFTTRPIPLDTDTVAINKDEEYCNT